MPETDGKPFVFVRHGETESNRAGWLAGSTDVALTVEGRRQARSAAALLAGAGVGCICSSPLRRGRDTAETIAEVLGLSVHVVPRIRERNWGAFEGRRLPVDLHEAAPPGGEPLPDFEARVADGLEECMRLAAGRTLLVVSHAGVFLALCDLMGLSAGADWVANARPVWVTPPIPGHRASLRPVSDTAAEFPAESR